MNKQINNLSKSAWRDKARGCVIFLQVKNNFLFGSLEICNILKNISICTGMLWLCEVAFCWPQSKSSKNRAGLRIIFVLTLQNSLGDFNIQMISELENDGVFVSMNQPPTVGLLPTLKQITASYYANTQILVLQINDFKSGDFYGTNINTNSNGSCRRF